MSAAAKAQKQPSAHTEPEEAGIATGIIKGLKDFKEGRITRFKNDAELAEHLRNL